MKKCNISRLCKIAGITRQAYYKGRKTRKKDIINECLVLNCVRDLRKNHPRMGGRKLLSEISIKLNESNVSIGRDRFLKFLKKKGLLVERKKKFTKTTYHDSSLPVYRNLLYNLEATCSNQVWVSDITYISTQSSFMYLSLITDLYSRRIVGWELSESLNSTGSITALKRAIKELPANRFPIHHSDRGSQYCCHDYVNVLNQRGLPVSMTEANHCYENATAERVNGILKDEYNLDYTFNNKKQAKAAVEHAILMYNNFRPHSSLGGQKPAQFHKLAA